MKLDERHGCFIVPHCTKFTNSDDTLILRSLDRIGSEKGTVLSLG